MVEVKDEYGHLAYFSPRLDGDAVLVQPEMGSPAVRPRIEEAGQMFCLRHKRSDVAAFVPITE